MTYMSDLLDKIDALIEQAIAETGDKKEKLLGKAGLDPAQVRKYRRNKWLYNDNMLEAFANIPGFPEAKVLKSWRLLEEYDEEVITLALVSALRRNPVHKTSVKKLMESLGA
ncbi:MAG: hypothetical protein K0Q50_195 [Vampirovibrio sp.]|jgi:hypothetical protein|nr:hypothetical protein [Vampirovibrio sp.]